MSGSLCHPITVVGLLLGQTGVAIACTWHGPVAYGFGVGLVLWAVLFGAMGGAASKGTKPS